MEADISIWRKPGHFYFALTRFFFHDSSFPSPKFSEIKVRISAAENLAVRGPLAFR
jgi:hypothetical protein